MSGVSRPLPFIDAGVRVIVGAEVKDDDVDAEGTEDRVNGAEVREDVDG